MIRVVLLTLAICLAATRPARADLTAFWGLATKPDTQSVRGFAIGINLFVIGFEGEYASAPERPADQVPGLVTGMINGLVQTPTSNTQLYLTAGGGFCRERLGAAAETSFGTNIGGGIKLGLAGPLRLRVDYRIFTLRGTPIRAAPQRLYTGLNLAF